MAFFEAGMGGSLGGQHRLRMQVDVLGQEPGNNRTLVRYNAWMERVISGSRVYNFYATGGTTNKNGQVDGRQIGGYDSRTAGQRWYLAQDEDQWVGHDANGNASPYFAVAYDAGNGPYLTNGFVEAAVGMPHIDRFTNITQFYVDTVTDTGFRIVAAVDATANFLQYSLEDGVGWRDQFGGNFNIYDFKLDHLPSNKPYNLRVRIRRADSGLWSESGVISTRTLVQSRFFDTMGLG